MERLYGLALALVPDEDAAGDLFMEARDEQDLLRRAERWRRRQGLAPLAALPAPRALTEAQQEHGAHLLRRAGRRLRLRRGLAAAAGALGLALVLLAMRPAPAPGLEADPVFGGASVAVSDQATGLQMRVYRAEATPGAVTLWWAVTGPNAGQTAARLTPELALGLVPTGWSLPAGSEVTVHRSDRVLIRSVYRLFAPARADSASLRIQDGGALKETWSLTVPLERRDADPSAHTYAVSHEAQAGPATVRLLRVTVGPNHTAVRYLADFADEFPFVALETPSALLMPLGLWQAGDLNPGEQEVVFDPLPPGAEGFTMLFGPRGWRPQEFSFSEGEHAPGPVDWSYGESQLVLTFTTPSDLVPTDRTTLQDLPTGASSPVQVEFLGMGDDSSLRWRLTGKIPPAAARGNITVHLRAFRLSSPVVRLRVDL